MEIGRHNESNSEVRPLTTGLEAVRQNLQPVTSVGGGSGEITCPAVMPEVGEPAEQLVEKFNPIEVPTARDHVVTSRPTHYFVVDERNSARPLLEHFVDTPEAIANHLSETQRAFVENLPQNTESLNPDRIAAYMGKLGLSQPVTVHLNETSRDEVNQMLRKMNGDPPGTFAGKYVPEIDTCIVYRSDVFEELNGPEYIDCLTVHENAHGSSEHNTIRYALRFNEDTQTYEIDLHTPRTGQIINVIGDRRSLPYINTSKGSFIEEGFADHIRGKYVAEELGLPCGLADMPADTVLFTSQGQHQALPIPSRYFVIMPSGRPPGISLSSYAGAAMDLLVEKDPALGSALIEARRSVEGLREVAGRINAIHPGLYVTLRDKCNAYADYPNALNYVRDVVGK